MAYKDAQQTLYAALQKRGVAEEFLTLGSKLPIHGNEQSPGQAYSPLTTERVKMMMRRIAKENHLTSLNISGINEARTFSQLTAILANSTPDIHLGRDIEREMFLAYVDIPLRPGKVAA